MNAKLRKLLSDLSENFWLLPGLMVALGICAAVGLVDVDRAGLVPRAVMDSDWVYNGGASGARTLMQAIVTSTIGVAGTVFSITIAALSLAAGQMGPRLLRNFTRDRVNQVVLGVFLGTFAYAMMVLRSVRGRGEGDFVPHLALTGGMVLALLSLLALVLFVDHMAGRINVDTVVDLVGADMEMAVRRLGSGEPPPPLPPDSTWQDGAPVFDPRRGYLQHLDADALADWAAAQGTTLRLLVRPGDYVFPGAPIAIMTPPVEDAERAIRRTSALGRQRVSSADLEYAVRQLVEVAVRALSPGINDPNTAMSVLERLGTVLCDLVSLHLPTGVCVREGRVVLVTASVTYDGLLDAMFHMIRQSAQRSVAVLIRLLEVLTTVLRVEAAPARIEALQRHADLALHDAEVAIATPQDLADVRARHAEFRRVRQHPPLGLPPRG